MPSRVFPFLIDMLKADMYKLSDDLLYMNVDTLEATDNYMCFSSDTDRVLVLCSEPV